MKQLFFNGSASFLGHRNIIIDNILEKKCNQVIEKLITQLGIKTFLFGSNSNFNDLCLKIVSNFKRKYSNIERIYVRAEYEKISNEYYKYLMQIYDGTIYPNCVKNSGKAAYVIRNRFMVGNSDIVVFYCDTDCASSSGAKKAYEYSLNQNKHSINLFYF